MLSLRYSIAGVVLKGCHLYYICLFCRYKFFFKSQDDDFGVVKEEISLDESPLPLFNGRVVSWLVQAEGSVILSEAGGNQHHISSSRGIDDLSSENGTSASSSAFQPPPFERSSGVGTTRPPSFHSNHRINRYYNKFNLAMDF